MNRSHKIINTSLFNLTSSLWLTVLHFFTTPFIVNKLGVDAYGIYSVMFVVIGYFGFMELGLGRAIIKFIAEFHAKKDYDSIKKAIGSALLVYCLMGVIGAVLIYLLTDLFITSVFKIPPGLKNTARWAFYFSAVGFLLNMPCNVFGAIPKALQRFDITNKIDIIFGSLQTIGSVCLLYLGFSLLSLVILNIIISFLSICTYVAVVKRTFPFIPIAAGFNAGIMKDLFRFGSMVTIDSLLVMLSGRINSFFVGIFLPISSLTYYVIPDSLASRVSFIPRSVSHAAFPLFSELHGLSSQESLRELFLRSTKIIVILTLPFMMLFTFFANKLLGFWIGKQFAENGTLILQLIGPAYILSFWAYISVEGARGLNKPAFPAKLQLVFSIINVILCFALIPSFGIVGAALAWSLHRYLLIPFFIGIIATKLFGISFSRLWNEGFKKSFGLVIFMMVISYPLSQWVNSLFTLVLSFVAISLLAFVGGYFIVMDERDRTTTLEFLRAKLNLMPRHV